MGAQLNMSDKIARANRYAQAVLQAMLERWQGSLGPAGKAISADKQLLGLLQDESASVTQKRDALAAILPSDAPEEISNLLMLMAQEGDLGLINAVSGVLLETVSGQRAPMKAEISSAIELTEAEQTGIRRKLVNEYGEGLIFSFQVDPALLGGLHVRVGDRFIDTSVATRLATLRESLTSAVR